MAYKDLNCIIVEDDEMSRIHLEHLCSQLEQINILESFSAGDEAFEYLKKNIVDVIFLDMEMPGMSGIEILEELDFLPSVIVVTSNPDYAVSAFLFDVEDFLVKPVTLPRLKKAISKVEKSLKELSKIAEISFLNELYIKVDGKLVRIDVEDICYFENVGDYVKVITEAKTYVIYGALKSINERLRHPRLLKVHRSYIINLGKIKDIEDGTIVMANGKVIPISRSHKAILMNSLNIL